MAKPPLFDFSHLTVAERIELAEQLWDSVPPESVETTQTQIDELRRRRSVLRTDGDLGEPWAKVIDEIDDRGA